MSTKKKQRGPQPDCPWDEQLKELLQHTQDIFYESGLVKELVQHKKIWSGICANLSKKGYRIKPNTIQSNVAQDRHDLLKLLQEKRNALRGKTETTNKTDEKIAAEVGVDNTLENVLDLHNDALLKPTLKEFSPYPYCQSFWSTDALKFAKQLTPASYVFGEVGTFTENFSVHNQYSSGTIVSHSLGTFLNNNFVPLCHISMEIDSIAQLRKFLTEILRDGCPTPLKIVLDYRRTHLKAATESFNTNYCYEKYLTTGYLCLKGESQKLPKCQISVDLGIILQIVKSTWLFEPSDLSEYLMDFFIDAIRLLHSKTSLIEFGETLKQILILITNRYENKYTKSNFEKLNIEFQSLSTEQYNCNRNYETLEFGKCNYHELDMDKCKEIIEYLKNIYKEACESTSEQIDSKRKNSFYSIVNTDNLLQLCIEFITWTRVMDARFGTTDMQCSTSVLQSYGEEFKLSLPNVTFPLKIQDYITKHVIFSENRLNDALAVLSLNRNDLPLLKVQFDGDHSYLTYTENWMGLNSSSDESEKAMNNINSSASESSEIEHDYSKDLEEGDSKHELIKDDQIKKKSCRPKKRGLLLEPCADFFLFKQLPKKIAKKRSLIRNSNLLADAIIDGSPVAILTSSAFDSFCEILVSSFYLINRFQKLLQSSDSAFFVMIAEYSANLQVKTLYQRRARILSRTFNEQFHNKLFWTGRVADLLKLLITASIERSIKCNSCNQEVIENMATLQVNFKDVVHLFDNINSNTLFPSTCSCGHLTNAELSVKDYLIIDIEDCEKDDKLQDINSLPLDVSINSTSFALTGVMCFKEGLIEPNARHYLAYALKTSESISGKRVWMIFDNTCKRYKIVKNPSASMVKPAILIYIQYDIPRRDGTNPTEHQNTNREVTLRNEVKKSTLKLHEFNTEIQGITGENAKICVTENCEVMDYNETNYSAEIECIDKNGMLSCTPNNSATFISTPDNSAFITSTPDNSAMVTSTPDTSAMTTSTSDKIQTSNVIKETSTRENGYLNQNDSHLPDTIKSTYRTKNDSIVEIVRCPEDILRVDLANATLKAEEKNQMKFSFDDINVAAINWENPQQFSKIIANAMSQERIQFRINDFQSVIQFTNTCGFDSIMESLKHCYKTNTTVRSDIEQLKSVSNIWDVLVHFIEHDDYQALYFYRAKFMFTRVPTRIDELRGPIKDCRMNLCSLFKDIMSDYPSIMITGTCDCGVKQKRLFVINEIDYRKFFDSGISEIGQILQEALSNTNLRCLRNGCNSRILNIDLTLGNYIAFDLELIHESVHEKMLSKYTGKKIKNYKTHLEAVPKSITFFNRQYCLSAVIEFREECSTTGLLHYVAYCRSASTNKWIQYNDLRSEANELQRDNLPFVKIALILYASQ